MRCSPHTAVTFSRLRELLSCGCALGASVALHGAELVTFIQTACCLCGFSLSGSQPLQLSRVSSACFLLLILVSPCGSSILTIAKGFGCHVTANVIFNLWPQWCVLTLALIQYDNMTMILWKCIARAGEISHLEKASQVVTLNSLKCCGVIRNQACETEIPMTWGKFVCCWKLFMHSNTFDHCQSINIFFCFKKCKIRYGHPHLLV